MNRDYSEGLALTQVYCNAQQPGQPLPGLPGTQDKINKLNIRTCRRFSQLIHKTGTTSHDRSSHPAWLVVLDQQASKCPIVQLFMQHYSAISIR